MGAAAIARLLYYGGIRLSGHPPGPRAALTAPGPCSAGDGRFTASPRFLSGLLPPSHLGGLAASSTSRGAVSFLCRSRGYHPRPLRGPAAAGRAELPQAPYGARGPPAAAPSALAPRRVYLVRCSASLAFASQSISSSAPLRETSSMASRRSRGLVCLPSRRVS